MAITDINTSIDNAKCRQRGLIKLAILLEDPMTRANAHLLEENADYWLKTLVQTLEGHATSVHMKLAHYCFYLLIQNTVCLSAELTRRVSTSHVEKCVNALINSNDQVTFIFESIHSNSIHSNF